MAANVPAMAIAGVAGLVLIAASGYFTVRDFVPQIPDFEVEWQETQVGSATEPVSLTGAGSADVTISIDVNNTYTGMVHFTSTACDDSNGGSMGVYTNPDAEATFVFSRIGADGNVTEIARGPLPCAGADEHVQVNEKPNATVREDQEDLAAARSTLWSNDLFGGHNETATYVVTVTVTRAQGDCVLPVGDCPTQVQGQAPTMDFDISLTVTKWDAVITEKGAEEVVR